MKKSAVLFFAHAREISISVVVVEKTNGAHGAPEQKTVMGGALPPRSDVRVENVNISFMRMFVTGGGGGRREGGEVTCQRLCRAEQGCL